MAQLASSLIRSGSFAGHPSKWLEPPFHLAGTQPLGVRLGYAWKIIASLNKKGFYGRFGDGHYFWIPVLWCIENELRFSMTERVLRLNREGEST